ncbi:MAG: CHAT domain-containing protein [Phycisphaerales bacterium]|jgi:CHAT domain-containing protein/tetratricopeptide (TPR) repeat protein|nr:CHAT domain-containing protein [Phycisphaerales bacterium]
MTVPASELSPLLDELAGLTPSEAIARVRAAGDAPQMLGRLSDDVERMAMSNLTRALAAAPALVSAADELAEPQTQARTRRALAHALAYANRFDDALATLADAVLAADRSSDVLEGARIRMATLHALARKGRLKEAIDAGEAALAAFTRAGESLLAARANINLGVVRRMSDEPRRAVEHFDRALTLLVDQPMLSAQLQSNRAEALLDLHEFRAAEDAFRAALSGLESLKASRAAAIVEGNLADLTSRQGRMQEGLAYFEGARRKLAADGAPGDVARLWIEQAEAMLSLGAATDAADAFQTAIPALRQHGMSQELARALLGLSRSQSERSQWAEARDSIAEVRSLLTPMNNRTGLAKADMLEARVLESSGDMAGSLALLRNAIRRLEDRPADAALAQLQLGDLLLRSSDPAGAAEHIETAMTVAETLDLAPLKAELHHARARARVAEKKHDDAAGDFAAAIDQTERVRGTLNAEALRAAFLGRRSNIFADAASFALDMGDVPIAFDRIERARARSMQEAAAPADSARACAPSNQDDRDIPLEIDRLRRELTAMYSRTGDVGASARGSTAERIAGVRQREHALRLAEQRLAALAPRRVVDRDPAPVRDVQRALAPGHALVEYFEEGDDLSAFIVTDQGTRVRRRVTDMAQVRRAASALAFQIDRAVIRGLPTGQVGQRLARDAERALRELHSLLLTPMSDDLADIHRMTIVPFGVLHRVPFHALIDDSGEPALARHVVTIAPSSSIAMLLRSRKPMTTSSPLVIGVSDEAIPHAEDEARAAASTIPNAELLIGSDATVENVSQAMHDRPLIHVASHARFVASNPGASGLRLFDGWMSAWNLGEIDLGGARVVLSGCGTGRAESSPGGELLGLVRAFLAAGASSLVLTHWALHDQSAKETVAAWYSSMYDNPTCNSALLAETLRRVQLEMFRQGHHPAGWAPFFVIGDA